MSNNGDWTRGLSVLQREIRNTVDAIPGDEVELLLFLLKYAQGTSLDEAASRLSKRLAGLRVGLSPDAARDLD